MDLSLSEKQQVEMDILRFIKRICDENGLKYYLAFGTLLGAVRHGGFIPWDDDIDILMPKPDLRRLAEIMKSDPHEYYTMVSIYNQENFTAPLPKIVDTRTRLVQNYGFIEKIELGLYVDIFPIDGAGNCYDEAVDLYDQCHSLYKKWRRSNLMMFIPGLNKAYSFIRWIKHIPEKLKGTKYWLNQIDEFTDEHNFDDCSFVGVLTNNEDFAKGNVFSKEVLGRDTYLSFEGELFRVPEKFDELLTVQYGDYMKLPPEDKRISEHRYSVEWIDKE